MRKFLTVQSGLCVIIYLLSTILGNTLHAQSQSLTMRDFSVFAASGVPGSITPAAPGYGVRLGSSNTINGGTVGSFTLVQTTGNANIKSAIFSGGRVILANSNLVTGRITAHDSARLGGTILAVGSGGILSGNIDVRGNIAIAGGTVSGIVTHPTLTSYTGPFIGSRNVTGTPDLPAWPSLHPITDFAPAGTSAEDDILTTDEIDPGAYRNVILGGNKTVTLQGPGTYVFNSFKLSGNANKLIFNFNSASSGKFIIHIHGDADFGKLNASFINGGDASRIFVEIHGKGTTTSIPGNSFVIANGSSGGGSKWLGTVWTPYAGINVGSGTGSSTLTGALHSGVQVVLQSGVTVNYSPLAYDENVIIPFNQNIGKVYTPIGAELTSITAEVSEEAKKQLRILGDYVLIDVIAQVGREVEARNFVIAEGMIDLISNGTNTLITTGKFPRSNLLTLNEREDIINFCRPVYIPLGNSGLIKNAGDTAIGSHLVRNGYNLQGLGVKVGVLSDSYNSQVTPTSNPAQLDISTGELPGAGNSVNATPVQVLQEFPYGAISDEGRAMLQIVHDIAPKAELGFRTGFISPGDFAIGIKQMQEAGYKVIVDDITFINEPFLQDGAVAKAVDEVKSLGVSYFTSAGNFSNKSQQQNYRAFTAPPGFPAGTTAHDFSGSGDVLQRLRLKPGSYTIALQWEDDIYSIGQTDNGGTDNDLDIYLTDLGGNIICGYNRDNVGGDPFEFLAFSVANTVTEVEANLLITRANTGTPSPLFKLIIFRGDAVFAEYHTGGSTIVGQANAAGAITVGAINYFRTPVFGSVPVVAPYSSVGGTLIGTQDRQKPDITATDGVNTSVNMGPDYAGDTDPFSNFFGTSSAAPHAAATAALLIEGRKRFLNEVLSPEGVKNLMQSTALNIGPANVAGAGLLQADLAMRSFAEPTPFLISLEYPAAITPTSFPTSSFTLTVNGNYFSDESQVYFRGTALPTTVVSTTQITAIIPAFNTGNPAVQVYTPPLANGDGGFSNTVQFFSIPRKTITITADPKTKRYGEQLPVFTSTILVNNVPLAQSGLSLQSIGLQNLAYTSNATPLSNVGSQYFIKPVRVFNPTNATDAALLELYTYDTIPGILTIVKLPVTVTPNDQTMSYGQDIPAITFRYEIDPVIATSNPQVVNFIRLSHQEFLASNVVGLVNRLPVAISNRFLPVAISNGFPIAISNNLPVAISNGEELPLYNAQSVTGFNTGVATVTPYTLTGQELANLSFYASEKSLASSRQLTANTKVIDIAQESILGYNNNPALTMMVNTVEPEKAKGILGAEPLSNGSLPVAISNRFLPVAISNAFPIAISNGSFPIVISNRLPVVISNGSLPIAISNSFSEQADRIAVVIDQLDVTQQTGIVLRALNTITGLSSGTQYIIPGSVLNDNYDITYGLGILTVTPANVTVKANNVTRDYGDLNPTFTATYSGLKYGEDLESSDISGQPSLTTTAVQSSPPGTYAITTAAGSLSSYNYTFSFQNGTMTIQNNPCLLTHKPFTNFGSTANAGTATSLWLNITTKVSGQLSVHGDYLLYSFGTVTFNNISSRPTVTDMQIPAGKIIADNSVPLPITRFDAASNTWITLVPVGFSSTSDIFITGVIINSSNGFVKKNNANTVVKGIFYSNRNFSDQWAYGIAAYQPQFNYTNIGELGQVTAINGTYRAGTPVTQLLRLVNGGSGGGGNNYTGSSSSFDNFTACLRGNAAITMSRSGATDSREATDNNQAEETDGKFMVTPNPAGNYAEISFVPSVTGNMGLSLFAISGVKVVDLYVGLAETGKLYKKRVNVDQLPSGIYFIRLQNGNKTEIKKLIIAR